MSGERWWLVATAAPAGITAWLARGTVAGGIAWVIVLGCACTGFGIAVERASGQRVSAPLTAATGLAAWLAVSTVLARLGWLGATVQLAAVLSGIAATLVPRVAPRPSGPRDAGPGAVARAALGGVAALLVIAISLMAPQSSIEAGWNHALAIKRLWDLGLLSGGPHQAGLQLVGEAYAALPLGAQFTSVFDGGLCAALVIFLVMSELRGPDRELATLLSVLVVVAIILKPVDNAAWSATLFHLSAILSLRAPLAHGRTAWHTVTAAIALGLVRDECWLLAAPYALAAIALPRIARPSRRLVAAGLALWLVTAFAAVLATGVRTGTAIAKALPLVGAIPLGGLLLHLLGATAWRSALGVTCVALAGYQLALATFALLPAVHSADITFAAWLPVGLAIAIDLVARETSDPYVRRGAPALAIVFLASTLLVLPMFRRRDSDEMFARLAYAVIAWRERPVLGTERPAEDIYRAQLQIPAGATLAFWGRSAARLEPRRNPIRDVSARTGALAPIAPASLRDAGWLIVEDPGSAIVRDPWLRERVSKPAIADVSDLVELHATVGIAHLYRVHRQRAAALRAP